MGFGFHPHFWGFWVYTQPKTLTHIFVCVNVCWWVCMRERHKKREREPALGHTHITVCERENKKWLTINWPPTFVFNFNHGPPNYKPRENSKSKKSISFSKKLAQMLVFTPTHYDHAVGNVMLSLEFRTKNFPFKLFTIHSDKNVLLLAH